MPHNIAVSVADLRVTLVLLAGLVLLGGWNSSLAKAIRRDAAEIERLRESLSVNPKPKTL